MSLWKGTAKSFNTRSSIPTYEQRMLSLRFRKKYHQPFFGQFSKPIATVCLQVWLALKTAPSPHDSSDDKSVVVGVLQEMLLTWAAHMSSIEEGLTWRSCPSLGIIGQDSGVATTNGGLLEDIQVF